MPTYNIFVSETFFVFSRVERLFGRALLSGHELPPSFPPQILLIVFLCAEYTRYDDEVHSASCIQKQLLGFIVKSERLINLT